MPASLNIAVLEDNDALRALTVDALAAQGHQVFGVYDAEGLSEALATRHIDLLIVDLNLPGEDGLSVTRRLKAVMPALHVIMMTARGSIDDRVLGYGSGADIYLPKPVSERELVAAVAGVARRIDETRAHSSELRLDIVGQQLIGTQSVRLTPTEFVLLKMLAQAPDQRAETFQLLEATQREVDDKAKASLEVQLVNLRKKIDQAGYDKPSIQAIRNEGYRLLCRIRIA